MRRKEDERRFLMPHFSSLTPDSSLSLVMESFFPSLEALSQLYAEIDAQLSLFAEAARIACLPNCRVCCETAKFVECSTLEMLPLSLHLWRAGKAECVLEHLSRIGPEGPCLLLDRVPSVSAGGGCAYYSLRPLTCRLFGFSAVPDKYGNPRMALCKAVKGLHPGLEGRLNGRIREGLRVPIAPRLRCRLAMLHPGLGQPYASVNLSLRTALEKVGYRMSIQRGSRSRGNQ